MNQRTSYTSPQVKKERIWHLYCFFLFVLLTIEWIYPFVVVISNQKDISVLWTAACFIKQAKPDGAGFSPQELAVSASVIRSYPLWSLPFFYWIHAFPLEVIVEVWKCITQIFLASTAVLLVILNKQLFGGRIGNYWWAILSLVFWYPVFSHLHVGQLSALQMFCLVSAVLLYRSSYLLLCGIALAVTTIKPQSLYLLYWVVGIQAIFHPTYRRILYGMGGTLLILALIGWQIRGEVESGLWPIRMAEVGSVMQPSVSSYLQLYFDGWGVARWFLAFVALCTCFLFRRSLSQPMSLTTLVFLVFLSLVSTPYVNVYDFLFLSLMISVTGGLIGSQNKIMPSVGFSLFFFLLLILCMLSVSIFSEIRQFIWLPFAASVFCFCVAKKTLGDIPFDKSP